MIDIVVVIEIDCFLLLEMITNYSTPNIAMLKWIAYIKSLNLKFKHIINKNNLVVEMLSRTRYEKKDENVEDIANVGSKFYLVSNLIKEDKLFFEKLYEWEYLDQKKKWSIKKIIFIYIYIFNFFLKRLKDIKKKNWATTISDRKYGRVTKTT